ncbi:MAG: hypothetical protein R8N23_10575 [Reichenbachiella sp.]|uniref:hypothetical protein n=1 Tax=Reichenbachiella sp. TaxID=2184521 RepID=UPI002965F6FC|nr:hypothetical protein [Reichenbachiella sp.]MDW3210303.1 hypothetical protein [Reichenbachiella sp.]
MTKDNSKNEQDELFWYLRSKGQGVGVSTTYERTEFGKHIDHMNAFYGSLSPDQQEAFVDPFSDEQEMAEFENSLTSGQLEFWGIIKSEAENLNGYAIPDEDISESDLAMSSLRTMLDLGLSDNPEIRAIQNQTIENLGGVEAAMKLAEDTINPDFELNPAVEANLIDAQNGEHEYFEHNNVVESFFEGQPFEVAGSLQGGVLPDQMIDKTEAPTVESPGIQIAPLIPDGP